MYVRMYVSVYVCINVPYMYVCVVSTLHLIEEVVNKYNNRPTGSIVSGTEEFISNQSHHYRENIKDFTFAYDVGEYPIRTLCMYVCMYVRMSWKWFLFYTPFSLAIVDACVCVCL